MFQVYPVYQVYQVKQTILTVSHLNLSTDPSHMQINQIDDTKLCHSKFIFYHICRAKKKRFANLKSLRESKDFEESDGRNCGKYYVTTCIYQMEKKFHSKRILFFTTHLHRIVIEKVFAK